MYVFDHFFHSAFGLTELFHKHSHNDIWCHRFTQRCVNLNIELSAAIFHYFVLLSSSLQYRSNQSKGKFKLNESHSFTSKSRAQGHKKSDIWIFFYIYFDFVIIVCIVVYINICLASYELIGSYGANDLRLLIPVACVSSHSMFLFVYFSFCCLPWWHFISRNATCHQVK